MGILTRLFDTAVDTIKINDTVAHLSGKFQELSNTVNNIDRRLIRIETILELAKLQKQLINHEEA